MQFVMCGAERRRSYYLFNSEARMVWLLAILVVISIVSNVPAVSGAWLEQGPGPILNGPNTQVLPDNRVAGASNAIATDPRSEEHTSELQSRGHVVCPL